MTVYLGKIYDYYTTEYSADLNKIIILGASLNIKNARLDDALLGMGRDQYHSDPTNISFIEQNALERYKDMVKRMLLLLQYSISSTMKSNATSIDEIKTIWSQIFLSLVEANCLIG